METEFICGHKAIVRHIFKPEEIKPNTHWISSLGNIVTVLEVVGNKIHYSWSEADKIKQHEKDSFAFQCRYFLIID